MATQVAATSVLAYNLSRGREGSALDPRNLLPEVMRTAVSLTAKAIASRLAGPPPDPLAPLRERVESLGRLAEELRMSEVEPAPPGRDESTPFREDVSTGCLPCAQGHLATIAGTLKEALRFAREEGMESSEVLTRLQTAREDVAVLERHDWTPEKILASPPEQQEIIRRMLPEVRRLRQQIIQIQTVQDLEEAAARAGQLSVALMLEVMKRTKKVSPSRVIELARRVRNGEMTKEEAVEELKSGMESGDHRDEVPLETGDEAGDGL